MANLETEFTLQELDYLKEKTEMCRSAAILMKTIAGIMIFTSIVVVIGLLVVLYFVF